MHMGMTIERSAAEMLYDIWYDKVMFGIAVITWRRCVTYYSRVRLHFGNFWHYGTFPLLVFFFIFFYFFYCRTLLCVARNTFPSLMGEILICQQFSFVGLLFLVSLHVQQTAFVAMLQQKQRKWLSFPLFAMNASSRSRRKNACGGMRSERRSSKC